MYDLVYDFVYDLVWNRANIPMCTQITRIWFWVEVKMELTGGPSLSD